jgi:nucleoside-diphosphate-sugar epimerase
VVHLAAYYDFAGEPSELYQTLTVQGTARLLSALQATAMKVEQFLFSSTLLVMRPSEDGRPIDESGAVEATWPYPESKLETEALIADQRGDIPAVLLRIAGVYDHLGRSPALTEHVRRIYTKSFTSWFFPGDASRGQAFVHLDDTIDAIQRAIDRRATLRGQQVFLIAEPEAMPYEALQHAIGDALHGREWPTIRVPKPIAKAGAWVQEKLVPGDDEPFIKPWMIDLADAHYPVDISRARDRLGWNPSHRLPEELTKILDAMRSDPRKWFEENGIEPPDEAKAASAEFDRPRAEPRERGAPGEAHR